MRTSCRMTEECKSPATTTTKFKAVGRLEDEQEAAHLMWQQQMCGELMCSLEGGQREEVQILR